MTMRLTRPAVLRTSVLLLGVASLVGCSGSASSEFGGALFIESCSLACTDGSGGSQVVCSIVDVTENQEISMLFSEPIDPSSVNASSLQVIDVDNGTTPDGLRFVDPLDPRRVVFRPTVSFQTGLNFSFLRNRSYEVLVPGESQGDAGPFIRSTAGSANQSRLLCTVLTSQGVSDTVPGDPAVAVFADVITVDGDGEPVLDENGLPILTRTQLGTDAGMAVTDLYLTSNIYFEFNELMNLPTVANNEFMSAPFIAVELDGDGNLSTAGADRSPISGSYTVTVDQQLLTTSLLFVPTGGFPAAGVGDPTPALIVVRIPSTVRDIAENPVTTDTGGGTLVAVAQRIEFDPVLIPSEEGETFDITAGNLGSQEAGNETGALWGGGILAPGVMGGTGRHGSLRISTAQTVILNTDSQDFPLDSTVSINVIGNQDAMTGDYPRSITETTGVFEFSTLEIAPQGQLIITGSQPARLLVRGDVNVAPNTIIDVSGRSAPTHASTIADNDDFFADPDNADLLPVGGPNASAGGLGGDRADLPNLMVIGGIENLNSERNGRAGGGIGGVGSLGRGNGGPQFPVLLPVTSGLAEANLMGVGLSPLPSPITLGQDTCFSPQMGGVGSGGGYSAQGGAGIATPQVPSTQYPVQGTQPGQTNSNGSVGLAAPDMNNAGYTTRILAWNAGNLRGGASGGGGGNHIYSTTASTAAASGDCMGTNLDTLIDWNDHSAASGGGGGGALELVAGRAMVLSGSINASGGNGGSAIAQQATEASFAMPGGGGSGGAVRLRAPELDLTITGRINVSGGLGGTAIWSRFEAGVETQGGNGSAGLIRIEDGDSGIDFTTLAARVLPSGGNTLDFLSVAPGFVDSSSVVVLRPDSISGATACWFRPPGPFQTLGARPDEAGVNTVESKGWTMDVVLTGGTTRPFRGSDDASPSWEEQYGNLLGYDLGLGEVASPIVVRFQGARSLDQTLVNPCDINLDEDPIAEIQAGSLTPWVAHPADLELLANSSGAPFAPTMIRYIVIFDRTNDAANTDTPGQILINEGVIGVDNFRIEADPR